MTLTPILDWFKTDYVNMTCSMQLADVSSHITRQAVWAVSENDELVGVACTHCGDLIRATD